MIEFPIEWVEMNPIQPSSAELEIPLKRMSGSRRIVAVIGISTIALLMVLSFVPTFNSISERSPHTKALFQVKELSLALRTYSADWGDSTYPPSLESLYPDYINNHELLFAADAEGNKIPMIYHGGPHSMGDSGAPLIEHPILFDGKKIVGYVGGHVTEERTE